jgi:hypothetical protein
MHESVAKREAFGKIFCGLVGCIKLRSGLVIKGGFPLKGCILVL